MTAFLPGTLESFCWPRAAQVIQVTSKKPRAAACFMVRYLK